MSDHKELDDNTKNLIRRAVLRDFRAVRSLTLTAHQRKLYRLIEIYMQHSGYTFVTSAMLHSLQPGTTQQNAYLQLRLLAQLGYLVAVPDVAPAGGVEYRFTLADLSG